MSYSKFIARLVTQRRALVWLVVAFIAALSLYILVTRLTLDTEVLNLLPGKFESVQGLKVYNNDFAQTRELTFALACQPDDVDKLEEFAPIFAQRLREQPWNTRVLAGSPMESPQGRRTICRASPSRSCSTSSRGLSPRPSPSCNRTNFRRASPACTRKSKPARRGRSLSCSSIR